MASRDDYSVGWICVLPIEAAAAKAAFDRIHDSLPLDPNPGDNNDYILGSVNGHNVVVAYPNCSTSKKSSVAGVATQLHASFKCVQFNLSVGIAVGVPDTKEDIRLGDVVVGKTKAGWTDVVHDDTNGERAEDESAHDRASNQLSPLLLSATGKAETAAIFNESRMPQYVSEIVRKDPATFTRPGPEQDVIFEPSNKDTTIDSEADGYSHRSPDCIRPRQPQEIQEPIVHYRSINSGHHLVRDMATQDNLAHKRGNLY